eukprot:CAMPEP_0183340880 /NCGR_PEP_ID=MMETSP0164_2-20130417/7283_1 /TAXON_ID=221442 /ORGANISM="Coccolithus pelagicus ssp braarudi, Strain PLY182g" /LENGTH=114 /DNA_ID=CAMNT_0025511085 /DNA_START=538 /DNA_END=881 /DNA_ORIENTATION=-
MSMSMNSRGVVLVVPPAPVRGSLFDPSTHLLQPPGADRAVHDLRSKPLKDLGAISLVLAVAATLGIIHDVVEPNGKFNRVEIRDVLEVHIDMSKELAQVLERVVRTRIIDIRIV